MRFLRGLKFRLFEVLKVFKKSKFSELSLERRLTYFLLRDGRQ